MNIDRNLVLHVARLAHLELSEVEVVYYEKQLGRVLEYIQLLEQVPAGKATDTSPWRDDVGQVAERPDVGIPPLPVEIALAEAPERRNSAFQVPKIIE